ncbi:MAG: SDR family NAD(P)-dependent oxidoreductase [Candidatus Gastranaerophilaceae bacterium]
MTLKNKNVLITGARGGIGKVLVENFAMSGATVYANLRKEDEIFLNFASEVSRKYDTNVIPVYFDITNTSEMKKVLKSTFFDNKNPVDVLVNNAGMAHGGFFQMTPVSKIKEVFEVNLFAQMEITQFVLKLMMRQKSGIIINMGSILGLDIDKGSCAYGVSKAALMAWTKTLALEAAQYGIRANAIAPGLVDTKMGGLMDGKVQEEIINSCSMKRLANPDEIAKTAIFLASEDSSFINGQIIRVDGGLA